MIGCQISYIPLGTEAINEAVDRILERIEMSGLPHEIGGMATTLRGDREDVCALVADLVALADSLGVFILDVRYSNRCGI